MYNFGRVWRYVSSTPDLKQAMNYYEVLGVPRDADTASIKRAFRSRAKQLHPDVNKAARAEKDFQLVNEAYQVLADGEKRRMYDLRLLRGTFSRRVYYRPGNTAARKEPEYVQNRFEKAFDQFLFFFMLMSGLGALFFGIYRAAIEPVDGANPYVGIVFGIFFTSLFLYVWDLKKRSGS